MTVRLPAPSDPADLAGASWPLGATVDGNGVTFAVHAPVATRVQLEIFDRPIGREAMTTTLMTRGDDGIWRARVENLGPGAHYGFRVWGPGWDWVDGWTPGSGVGFVADLDEAGNRFNPNKLLFDPYAREISHSPASSLIEEAGGDGGMFGTGGDNYRGRPRREFDTAPWAPKGIVINDATSTGTRPELPAQDALIYEAHVKNLTLHSSSSRLKATLGSLPGFAGVQDVPEELRGTYAGAALMAPYLKAVGITTIELMPVHETSTDSRIGQTEGTNHWGYQTLAFFAPNRDYAHDRSPGGPTREFKEMVRAFHDAGLEVYLDVVYNHTGEGGHWGGDLNTTGFVSLGGFATADYYVMTDEKRLIDGATGTENQANMSSAASQNLVTDSLKYWADAMGVDGFRFDLAPVLGRKPDDAPAEDWGQQSRFFNDHPLLLAIRDLAAERKLEVIAEAWDLWGYEVGNFPTGWAEWNGRYRDAVRAFMKGDAGTADFMRVVNGDFKHFADTGGPERSINFLDAHDGFTLADLVSYNGKLNDQPYPFGPSDGGSDNNTSWDSNGDQALRRQRLRNFLTVLFLSRGVPMIVSGDEYGRTQNGNNNPWAINTVGVWNNYDQAGSNAPGRVAVDPDGTDPGAKGAAYHDNLGEAPTAAGVNPILAFTAAVAQLRHSHPALRQRAYADAAVGGNDVSYLFARADGSEQVPGDEQALRLLINGAAVGGSDLLVMINMTDSEVPYVIPAAAHGEWRLIVDTSARAESECNTWRYDDAAPASGQFTVPGWSVCVLESRPGPGSGGQETS